jgi:hypothetical protein
MKKITKILGVIGICLTTQSQNLIAQNTFPSTGNVGIGTLSPAYLLHVTGGDVKFIQSGEEVSFARPAMQNGLSLSSVSGTVPNRADIRFDGYKLQLLASGSTSAPSADMGISINTKGWSGFGNSTPNYRLDVVNDFSNSSQIAGYFLALGLRTVYAVSAEAHGDETSYGVYSIGSKGTIKDVGVYGYGEGRECTSDAYGVQGYAAQAKNNYGIWGSAARTSCEPGESWAGYFVGDTYCTNGIWSASDEQFKENIKSIDNALNIIQKLKPHTYTFKQSDELSQMNFSKGLKYGLIAQELETVLPELVKNNHNPEIRDKDQKLISSALDFKAVDYTSLIPILVQGIKEQQIAINYQQTDIDNLKQEIALLKENKINTDSKAGSNLPILYQNNPNPFNEETTIKYHLVDKNEPTSIMIFNMNGRLEKSIDLNSQIVDGEAIISSGSLQPGIYYYSLVIKGKEISTMKMIINK